MVNIDLNWLNVIGSVVLPTLVALVTKRIASAGLKSLVLALLSVVSGLVQELVLANGVFEWRSFAANAFTQFVLAVVVHYGLMKPLGVTGSSGAIAQAVPGGVGGTVSAADPARTSRVRRLNGDV